MGTTVSVVSAVLKSVVGEKVGAGLAKELADISVDAISEKGINEIADFIDKEKSKIDHILSRDHLLSLNISENHIDFVVAEIKDLFSRIQITDEVFRECGYDSKNLKDFMWNRYIAYKNSNIEYESDIKIALFAVAKTLTELLRESEEFTQKMLIQINSSVEDANNGIKQLSIYLKEHDGKLDENICSIFEMLKIILEQNQQNDMQSRNMEYTGVHKELFKNNKKQDYIKNWNSRLFLHIDNDENPITLADAFIMPDYIAYKTTEKIFTYSDVTLDKVIENFVEYDETSTLLITGVPGIGKSSITAWIAQKYEMNDSCIILRFRDWEIEELEEGLLKAIYRTLECKKKDLNSKVLVLDGFDEIKSLDRRDVLLYEFLNDINDFEKLKIVITSRSSYIIWDSFYNVIELNPFEIEKIKKFYQLITGVELSENNIDSNNLDVLGVPVILYMAIMSSIDITKNTTKPELYNRIFAEERGIFDRFCGYDKGSQIMRNRENIKKYLFFLRKVAFKMFEKNDLVLSKEEYKAPKLSYRGKKVSVLEFPIKHLFENTPANIEFIHKSIYEYFISEYIYNLIEDVILKESENIETDLAGVLGELLSSQGLSDEILEFLRFKIRIGNLKDKYTVVNETFRTMLRDGMTYYTKKRYKNVIQCEINVFVNMLEVIHLWEENLVVSIYSFAEYLRLARCPKLNLRGLAVSSAREDIVKIDYSTENFADWEIMTLEGVNLENADLENADLRGADLENADLRRANLRNADLRRANLRNADLRGADLSLANIQDIELEYAILEKATLDQNQFNHLKDRYDLRSVIKNVL